MTGNCLLCNRICEWVDCPTGGWWVHIIQRPDGHDADPGWQPEQDMDDDGYLHSVKGWHGEQ